MSESVTEEERLNGLTEIAQRLVFPQSIGGYTGEIKCFGITKRELFAAMVLQGILARSTTGLAHERAATAVEHADALLRRLSHE